MEGPQLETVRPIMAETRLPDLNEREKITTTQPLPSQLSNPEDDASSPWHNRSTLCIGSSQPGISLHKGDSTFLPSVSSLFRSPESRAAEKLMLLKQKLPLLDLNAFWTTLMEGLTDILNSQYLFVTKRILVNDHDSAVEMPSIGEPGSCLMAVAFYYNDGKDNAEHVRDFAYEAFGSACAQMKHDKVFIVPNGLYEFVAEENKKNFAFPVDAYIGVPLFAEGKCFAHYGALWTQEALRKSGLSWGYIEMVMHSCEDLIAQRLIKGQSFTKRANKKTHVVIPKAVVSATQSLRPYARSLSHELRTPMQGVVGMLDIMHATVHEALENPPTNEMAGVLRTLRQNIEMVQDSSRRAVEAADNVVHAYELDMQVPGSPVQEETTTNEVENENDNENDVDESTQEPESEPQKFPKPTSASPKRPSTATSTNPYKRRRVSDDNITQGSPKMRAIEHTASGQQTPRTEAVRSALRDVTSTSNISSPTLATPSRTHFPDANPQSQLTPSKIRSVLHVAVHECLRFGGRPESAIAEETPLGEVIEVETRRPDGTPLYKRVEWSVSAEMPELELASVDERDFAKLVSVLILNSLKFTAEGRIDINVAPSPRGRFLLVTVKDTGSGIPATFRPQLFKPFSREDDTITRSNEGLGLGLLVAKGLARRLGGDLDCIRSETSGPSKGSEFELKIPLMSSDGGKSGQSTPSRTRTPTPTRRTSGGNLGVAATKVTSSPRVVQETFTGSPEEAHAQLFSAAKTELQMPVPVSSTSVRPPMPTPTIDVFPPTTPLPVPQPVPTERRESIKNIAYDRYLAKKYPLKFMVAEDNRLNRTLLVTMLSKLGYTDTREAFDGREAVRLMEMERARSAVKNGSANTNSNGNGIDMILMDLWMPNMDGYEATRQILAMDSAAPGANPAAGSKGVKIVAVTADVTDTALDKARAVGMVGSMTKPYRLTDLERLIVNHCTTAETTA